MSVGSVVTRNLSERVQDCTLCIKDSGGDKMINASLSGPIYRNPFELGYFWTRPIRRDGGREIDGGMY